MSEFIEAVNSNGAKQTIPQHWLEEGGPFADQFRLPPSAKPEPKPEPEVEPEVEVEKPAKPERASAK